MSSSLDSYMETLLSTEELPLTFQVELPDVKKPVKAYLWKRSSTTGHSNTFHLCIYTHGAGGTCMSTASLNLCQGMANAGREGTEDQDSLVVLGFDGPMHLGSRTKTFVALIRWAAISDKIDTISLAGRSMGCRAAAIAAKQCMDVSKLSHRLILQSYPLIGAGKGTKDEERKQVLLDLPDNFSILFQTGGSDDMCPMAELQELQASMEAHCSTVIVEQADHGMQLSSGVAPRGGKAKAEEDLGRTMAGIAGEWLLKDKPEELGDGTITIEYEEEELAISWSGFGKPAAKAKSAGHSQNTTTGQTKSKRKAEAEQPALPKATPNKRSRRSKR